AVSNRMICGIFRPTIQPSPLGAVPADHRPARGSRIQALAPPSALGEDAASRGRLAAMNDQPAAPAADAGRGAPPAGAGFALGQALPSSLLYRRCDPAELPFEL